MTWRRSTASDGLAMQVTDFPVFWSRVLYASQPGPRTALRPTRALISANNGHWSLKANNGYTDGGEYSCQLPDISIAAGQLGMGAWHGRS
jgi:hypothetical protein